MTIGCRGVVLLLVLFTAAPAAAHHSVLGFDDTRGVTVRGAIADVHWADPHTYVTIAARTAAGREERWRVETESAAVLRRLGWNRDLLRPGVPVAFVGAPARDGSRSLRCQTMTLGRGEPMPCYPVRSL